MSRIGDRKINIPDGISVTINDYDLVVKNSNEEQLLELPKELSVKIDENFLRIERKNESKQAKSLHGTFARLISNSIRGLSEGFEKKLEFKGVGFTASVTDGKLVMRLGFSHQIEIPIPKGVEVSIQKNIISVKGSDKDKVGLFAAKTREVKKPEVYKGKGIRYQDENVKKKAGKAAQAAAA